MWPFEQRDAENDMGRLKTGISKTLLTSHVVLKLQVSVRVHSATAICERPHKL